MTKIKSLFVALVLTFGLSSAFAGTLDTVKERGKLMCGSNTGLRALVILMMLVFGKVLTLMFVELLQLLFSEMLLQLRIRT